MLEIVWGLLQKGLTGEGLLRTFLSRGVQSLHLREAAVKVPLALNILLCPFSSRPGGAEVNSRVPGASALEDLAGLEAYRACSEGLRLQRLKRRVEGELELICSRVARVEKLSPVASVLADRGIMHPP
jgi:hypothetical protein